MTGSGPPAPGLLAASREVARLELLRQRRGGKHRLALAFAVLLPAIVAVAHHLGPPDTLVDAPEPPPGAVDPAAPVDEMAVPTPESVEDPESPFEAGARWAFFSLLVFAFPFLFGVGAISEEVERRSLPYLLVRPVPRRAVALGKLVAVAGSTTGYLALGLALMFLGVHATSPETLVEAAPGAARITGSVLVLGVTYAAVAVCWSAVLPESAAVVTAAHFGVLELLFGMAPGALRLVSANHLARELAGLAGGGLMPAQTPAVPTSTGLGLILGLGLLAAAVAIEVVRWSELRKLS